MKYRVRYRAKILKQERHKDFNDPQNAAMFQSYLKSKGIHSILRKVGPTITTQYKVI